MTDAWRKDWGTWHEYCRKLKRYYDATDVAITERPELEPWGMNPPPCVIVDATLAMDSAYREMEGQLCRAREQLKLTCEWLVGSNYSTVELEKMMHDINAIPSPTPCRHEVCTNCYGGCPDKDHPAVHHLCEECHRENIKAFNLLQDELKLHAARFTIPIICICGSTRFKQAWIAENARLTGEGNIVLAVGLWGHHERVFPDEATKKRLDELHLRKIDLCDWVWVLDIGGYIGESTRNEIAYAETHGKPVRYLSKEIPGYVEPVDPLTICTECNGGCPDKDHPATRRYCEECWQHGFKKPIEILQTIASRVEDTEGMAKFLETVALRTSSEEEIARVFSAWLRGEG